MEKITVFSVLLNIILFIWLIATRNKGKSHHSSNDGSKKVKKEFNWKLDSSRSIGLKGHLELEFDQQAVLEQRRHNPFGRPSINGWNHRENLKEMYHYMLANPQHLAASAKIVQYINRICSQKGINEFDKLQFVLDFVQEPNIKYIVDDRSQELAGAQEYIRYPDETLFDGRGDCDCKAFLAATLYHLMGYNVLYIISDKLSHAAICIEYDSRWGTRIGNPASLRNATIEIEGRWYIYCETTSDGFRIGNMSKKESLKDFETILELRA